MTALAYDLLGAVVLGEWDTVKESVLGGVTLVSGTASGTLTGLVKIG